MGPSQDKAKFIVDATVRRDVVVELILEMKRRKHKAYIHIDEERARSRRPGSPRRAGPGAARTRRYFGADFVPARMLAIFLEEQVELPGVT